jgi:predicted anti-sigma-YlaC factor YlaD
MQMSHLARALPWLLLLAPLCGCSIENYAIDKLGDALSKSGKTFASDDDPELVAEAVPFSLKLIESLLESRPEHGPLLLAATRGFTQYSWAFVQQRAERLETVDLAASEELRGRARRLFLRARGYGLRALDLAHPGFEKRLRADPVQGAAELGRADVERAYWLAAAWGGALTQAKDSPALLADQPIVEALLDRALVLDEHFEDGALHTLLVSYESSRPGGQRGWQERSRAHFARAVELSKGRRAGPYVALAESVCVQEQRKAEFDELIGKALAIDADTFPDARLENLVMQARARWLVSRESELFLE